MQSLPAILRRMNDPLPAILDSVMDGHPALPPHEAPGASTIDDIRIGDCIYYREVMAVLREIERLPVTPGRGDALTRLFLDTARAGLVMLGE